MTLVLVAGALPGRAEDRPTLSRFLGINGHTVQFRPALYRPVCGLVRDYHPVEWDLGKETSRLPEFPFAKNRVNWEHVYGSWRDQGWTIDVCLMFESVPRETWKAVDADARAYGEAFAREFGPSGTRRLVDSVEIGNEPGGWDDASYSRMFRAMAEGVRSGDKRVRIATCNLTTGPSGKYAKSVDCIAGALDLVDVLTIHTYAQLEPWPTWRRSFPEDPALTNYLADVESLCRWRDTNAPGKPVWVTEFGYDSTTRPGEARGTFAKWVGVNDVQQAQWLVRSILVFSSMPVDRAYVYFFNDRDEPSLHASSGITRNFEPKPAFHALAHLQRVLGDFRFLRVVRHEPGRARVHEYRDPAGALCWVLWSPTGDGRRGEITIDAAPGRPGRVEVMPLDDQPLPGTDRVAVLPGGWLRVTIDESPLYIRFGGAL